LYIIRDVAELNLLDVIVFAWILAFDTDRARMFEESTASDAIVVANATTADPLNEIAGAVTSPVSEKLRPVARVVAVVALPDNAAVPPPAASR